MRQRNVFQLAHKWPLWPWCLLFAVAMLDTGWLLATPLSLDSVSLDAIRCLVVSAGCFLILARVFRMRERIYTLAAGISFMLLAWPTMRLFNHLTMTLGMPLADDRLAAWDALIGFDWLSYVQWADSHPTVLQLMSFSYTGLTGYSAATFLAILVLAGGKRARDFVLIFFVTGLIATAVGAMLPADAAMIYYAPDLSTFHRVNGSFGTYHFEIMHRLRSDSVIVLSLDNLPGLVTFPSFHTAMGVIAIYCSRGSPILFLPVTAINSVMIASTPVCGSHYLIDVIAGALLALSVSILLSEEIENVALKRSASSGMNAASHAGELQAE